MLHRMIQHIVLCVVMLITMQVFADEPEGIKTFNQWQEAISNTRQLAENNPGQALIDAKQLLASQPKPSIPTVHIDILNVIARAEIYLGKIEDSDLNANLALKLAQLKDYKLGQIEALLNRTLITVNQADLRATTAAAENSLALLDDVDRPDLLAEAMLRMMTANYRRGWIDEAVTLGAQNLEIANQNNNPWALLYASHGFAVIHHYNGHYEEAFEYFVDMERYAKQVQSKLWLGHALLGQAYAEREQLKREQRPIKPIESLYQSAIDIFKNAQFPLSLASALTGYATFLSQQQRYQESEKFLSDVVALTKQNKTPIPQWYTLNEYSLVLDKLGRTKEAFAIANQAYDLAKKIEYPFYSGESAANLAQHIAKQEDFELAYQYMLESHAISNEVTMQRANRNVSDLTERYKQESKQKQIDKLQNEAERREVEIQKNELQRRLLWTILAASSIVILLSGYFIWRLRRSNMMLGQLNRNVQLSQSKLQAVVDALPDALFVLDRKGTFLEVHSAIFEKSLGVGLGELKGQNISVLLPEQVVNSLISKLQYLEDSSVPLIEEISLALTDGEHWLELSVVRANWMTDGHEQFVVLARDITDRKQIEVIKQQTEQQFRTLVEHSPDPVIRYDNEARRVYMNDAFSQHVGLSSIDMLGKLVGDQLQDKLEQAELVHYKSVINQVIKTGTEHRILLSGRFMDEQLHYADIRLCPEFDVAGQVQSVLTLWRDVTELKQAEQKIEQAYGELRRLAERREEEIEEERKRIARDIHDELGQYLTGLKMRISILRMQPDISQQQLSAQISTMLTMLNDTISVVRKLASQIRPVQLSVGINAAIESLVGDLIKETKLICSFESDCSDDEIDEAISIVLFRLLQESLTNIRRHANAKTVDIELRQNQQGYQLKISDDGTGFDTRQNKEGHFGLLGMRERVNNLNGTMTLESILGQGTTITVSIPNPTKAIEDD